MINQDKWIGSLPKTTSRFVTTTNQLDHDRWINSIPKKNVHTSVKKYSLKKYSLMAILFVCGLLFVSAVKNEARNLEKEINSLRASK